MYRGKEQLEERYCEALIDTRGNYDRDQLAFSVTPVLICTFVEGPESLTISEADYLQRKQGNLQAKFDKA
jgi:hypothetical protein